MPAGALELRGPDLDGDPGSVLGEMNGGPGDRRAGLGQSRGEQSELDDHRFGDLGLASDRGGLVLDDGDRT
nr:hypothetical protein [Kineosporia sp. A_224]